MAVEKLLTELTALGVTDAYDIGDGATLPVWIDLVVSYRDGVFRWREGDAVRQHRGDDPHGCAVRVARRYHALRATVPPWWHELAELMRGRA